MDYLRCALSWLVNLPPPRNKGLIRPYYGKVMVNSWLISLISEGSLREGRLTGHKLRNLGAAPNRSLLWRDFRYPIRSESRNLPFAPASYQTKQQD